MSTSREPGQAAALDAAAHEGAFELFRTLLRHDTTNPPGAEAAAARTVADFLADGGLDPEVIETAPGRACTVARLKGTGEKPPLLLAGHLDVVPAEDGPWTRPPFAAEVHEGWLYGRGAVDMKNMVAMSAAILRHLAEGGVTPDRDLIVAAVADEEAGCDHGATYLVDHHPDLVRAEYALGEVGGFSMYVMGRTFYPVQVAEKGVAWLKATTRGEAGHGSMPRSDSAVVRLAEAVAAMGRTRLPQHTSEVVETYFKSVARHLPAPARQVLPRLLNRHLSGLILDRLLPDPGLARTFSTALSNTVSPTVLRAGTKINVIPGEASVQLDGRTLPGQTAAQLVAELTDLVGEDVAFEVLKEAPPVQTSPDTEVYRIIADALVRADPEGIPVPYLLPGFTDAKAFHRLGTRWYGCAPVRLPKDAGVAFAELYHRPDERIPVDGFHWGLDVLADIVTRIVGAP